MKKKLILGAVLLLMPITSACSNSGSKKQATSHPHTESVKRAKVHSESVEKQKKADAKAKAVKESKKRAQKKAAELSQSISQQSQSSQKAATQSQAVQSSTTQTSQAGTTTQYASKSDDPNSAENKAAHAKGGMLYGAPKSYTTGDWGRDEDAPTAKWRTEHGYND